MSRALAAGAAYFGIIFALGFVLGTTRELIVAPRLGPMAAVLIEVPVMVAASFATARVLARRLAVPDAAGARLTMGGIAFVLLMAAEMLTGLLLIGRSPGEQLALTAARVRRSDSSPRLRSHSCPSSRRGARPRGSGDRRRLRVSLAQVARPGLGRACALRGGTAWMPA